MSKNCEVSSAVFHVDQVVAAATKALKRLEDLHNEDVAGVADHFIKTLHNKNHGWLRRCGILKKISIPTRKEVINSLNMIYAPGDWNGSVFQNSPAAQLALDRQLDIYVSDWDTDMSLSFMYSDYHSSDAAILLRRLAALRADTLADTKVTLSINDAARIGLI